MHPSASQCNMSKSLLPPLPPPPTHTHPQRVQQGKSACSTLQLRVESSTCWCSPIHTMQSSDAVCVLVKVASLKNQSSQSCCCVAWCFLTRQGSIDNKMSAKHDAPNKDPTATSTIGCGTANQQRIIAALLSVLLTPTVTCTHAGQPPEHHSGQLQLA